MDCANAPRRVANGRLRTELAVSRSGMVSATSGRFELADRSYKGPYIRYLPDIIESNAIAVGESPDAPDSRLKKLRRQIPIAATKMRGGSRPKGVPEASRCNTSAEPPWENDRPMFRPPDLPHGLADDRRWVARSCRSCGISDRKSVRKVLHRYRKSSSERLQSIWDRDAADDRLIFQNRGWRRATRSTKLRSIYRPARGHARAVDPARFRSSQISGGVEKKRDRRMAVSTVTSIRHSISRSIRERGTSRRSAKAVALMPIGSRNNSSSTSPECDGSVMVAISCPPDGNPRSRHLSGLHRSR